jgi:hypothetical protein
VVVGALIGLPPAIRIVVQRSFLESASRAFSGKWNPVFRPKMRSMQDLEQCSVSMETEQL